MEVLLPYSGRGISKFIISNKWKLPWQIPSIPALIVGKRNRNDIYTCLPYVGAAPGFKFYYSDLTKFKLKQGNLYYRFEIVRDRLKFRVILSSMISYYLGTVLATTIWNNITALSQVVQKETLDLNIIVNIEPLESILIKVVGSLIVSYLARKYATEKLYELYTLTQQWYPAARRILK